MEAEIMDINKENAAAAAAAKEAGAMSRLEKQIQADKDLLAYEKGAITDQLIKACLLYTSPSPRDRQKSRMPSSA